LRKIKANINTARKLTAILGQVVSITNVGNNLFLVVQTRARLDARAARRAARTPSAEIALVVESRADGLVILTVGLRVGRKRTVTSYTRCLRGVLRETARLRAGAVLVLAINTGCALPAELALIADAALERAHG